MTFDPSVDPRAERLFAHQARIAAQLRSLADRVERQKPAMSVRSAHPYASLASDIIHEVTWGVANLNLSSLTEAAADAEWFMSQSADGA